MAVLRCPYCGEKVNPGDKFCSKCGNEFDKPHIDEVDTAFQDVGRTMVKLVAIVVLWFIVLIVLGLIGNVLNVPVNLLFILSFVVTIAIVAVVKLKG